MLDVINSPNWVDKVQDDSENGTNHLALREKMTEKSSNKRMAQWEAKFNSDRWMLIDIGKSCLNC